MRAVAFTLLILATSVSAELFSFTNEQGQYLVSKTKPRNPGVEYAVLRNDGEFVHLVRGTAADGSDHWRPWYVPKEPRHLYAPPLEIGLRIPVVSVIEVAAADEVVASP